LLLQTKEVAAALTLVNGLLFELKKLDDKQMLTEVHLTEARVHQALQNIPKCKNTYVCMYICIVMTMYIVTGIDEFMRLLSRLIFNVYL